MKKIVIIAGIILFISFLAVRGAKPGEHSERGSQF
jgi:hypothetical protein